MRADDIVFEYRFTELKFSNKIRKTCETEEDFIIREPTLQNPSILI